MKLADYIDYCLCQLGIKKVFGIPGSLVMPIWQSITNAEIILCSHEQEASYLATGYIKKAKCPAAVITTGGPGVTNCISGIASANIDSLPLIYISGRTPLSKNGMGVRQEESKYNRMYDSVNILSELTKKSVCISDLNCAAKEIRDVFKCALENRQGAVHISVPVDLQQKEIQFEEFRVNKKKAENCEFKIPVKRKCLIILGWGNWMANSYTDVYKFAEQINAPVLVTSKAYCCIDPDSPMYLGKLGYGYCSPIDSFLEQYKPETIIAFGTSLGNKDIEGTILKRLITCVDTFVVGDEFSRKCSDNTIHVVKCTQIESYVKSLSAHTPKQAQNKDLIMNIYNTRKKSETYWDERIEDDQMASCIKKLNSFCDGHTVITADAGNHLANTGAIFVPKGTGRMFLDVGLRAMGTGICSTVGMAIADNDYRYVAITGDGCMLMNGNVMHIAKEMELPIVFLVFNNHALGRVRVGQSIMNDYRATDIFNVDFQNYGKAFGIDTYQFSDVSDFENSIESILEKRNTCLVEVLTGRDEVPVSVKGKIT